MSISILKPDLFWFFPSHSAKCNGVPAMGQVFPKMLDRKRSQVLSLSLGLLQPDTMTSGLPTELRGPQNPTQGTLKLPAKLSWPPPALLLFLMLCVIFTNIKGRSNCNSTCYLLGYSCTFSLRAVFHMLAGTEKVKDSDWQHPRKFC